MISRRTLLKTSAAAAALPLLPAIGWTGPSWRDAAEASPLIYLTPIQSSGAESRCQAEIWFASVAGAMYVVTAAEAWRAEAVRQGLSGARIWVGDVGPWRGSDGKYKALPAVDVQGRLGGGRRRSQPGAGGHGRQIQRRVGYLGATLPQRAG